MNTTSTKLSKEAIKRIEEIIFDLTNELLKTKCWQILKRDNLINTINNFKRNLK